MHSKIGEILPKLYLNVHFYVDRPTHSCKQHLFFYIAFNIGAVIAFKTDKNAFIYSSEQQTKMLFDL